MVTAMSPDSLNLAYLEELYQRYQADHTSVPEEWRAYFTTLVEDVPAALLRTGPRFKSASVFNPAGGKLGSNGCLDEIASLQDRVDQLVRAYRVRGHAIAAIDPLGQPRLDQPELHLEHFNLTERDLDRVFSANTIVGPERLSLRQIIERLHNTYCRSIGVQFMHIDDIEVKAWLMRRMECTQNRLSLDRDEQLTILTKLTDAVIFEEFMQKKFIGAKRFSLEGGETLIPLLLLALNKAAEQGLNGVVIGMAHRGRLNVLANIIGKSQREIFQDFEGVNPEFQDHLGDVKYHQGHGTTWTGPNGHRLHVSLCFNPSHLEFVNPVALGRARANIDRYASPKLPKGMAILIHGDAAFAGQGIVQEILNMSQLPGYTTGGTVHVIHNNQIGFTTDPQDSRSTPYATDVAKLLQSPIFHVNGEDPEAVAQVVNLALDFRWEFKRDVVIDMYCYRRRGHNEGDEPSFTQPLMYEVIKQKSSVREIYRDRLVELGEVSKEQADDIALQRRAHLEDELAAARQAEPIHCMGNLGEIWSRYRGGPQDVVAKVDTGVPLERLTGLLNQLCELPSGFTPHPKIARWLEQRRKTAAGTAPVDWASAEALAFASIAISGLRVRLTGQDSQRGTFSHRHAVLHDYHTNTPYMPLKHLAPEQAPVDIFNSPLSEAGVLGFEYGYSLDCPDALVLWEAQFGDFVNGAQVIIDQFIVSAEDKWGYFSGLVLLLPHGFEGMGPEHSSARLERFLLLAADHNIQVVQPSTPAQLFHVLRRQVVSEWRKPLIVLTPKSLLRDPLCVSSLEDLVQGRFHRVRFDRDKLDTTRVKKLLLCSGKMFYELYRARAEQGRDDVGILRLEQLYPLSEPSLLEALEQYPAGIPVVWVQEEPENMGAWHFLQRELGQTIFDRHPLSVISRPAAASPATGSAKKHLEEEQQLVSRAMGDG
jgi:2-oxoglutarate dehydrogenase E1 component